MSLSFAQEHFVHACGKGVFCGNPHCYSEMFDHVYGHSYYTFYNKTSGTSLKRWLPVHVHQFRNFVHNGMSDHSIFQADFVNNKVVSEQWIHQHFAFNIFPSFGFVDVFNMECGCLKDMRDTQSILLDVHQAMYSDYQEKIWAQGTHFHTTHGTYHCYPHIRVSPKRQWFSKYY